MSNGNGLTKTGQKLFQNAIESYYILLCVGRSGANMLAHYSSSNTGYIPHSRTKYHCSERPVKLISNMRMAIKDTNVVLNMVIAPGLIIIPSNMIILKKKLDGYNNVLTIATIDMSFGVNKDINYVEPVVKQKKEVVKQIFFPLLTVKENCICWAVRSRVKPYYSIFCIINKLVLSAADNTN